MPVDSEPQTLSDRLMARSPLHLEYTPVPTPDGPIYSICTTTTGRLKKILAPAHSTPPSSPYSLATGYGHHPILMPEFNTSPSDLILLTSTHQHNEMPHRIDEDQSDLAFILTDILPNHNHNTNTHRSESKNDAPSITAWVPPKPTSLLPNNLKHIYNVVAESKLPNMDHAKCTVPSALCIDKWHDIATGHHQDNFVLNGIEFGFSIEYLGNQLPSMQSTENHSSARAYPEAIEKYIQKELQEKALIGPFKGPPFAPFHVSPLMTRPKASGDDRRIIVDLSFPEGGVNKWVIKGFAKGELVSHNLPTIEDAIQIILGIGVDKAWLASIDISRAYRNFRTCPRDWPLLGIMYGNSTYLDTALPFGARMSSFYMQRIAEFLCRALQARGMTALMYLDDLLVISSSLEEATSNHHTALELLGSLGLPVAPHKVAPPERKLVWLGIRFDMLERNISIPKPKLAEILKFIKELNTFNRISLKTAQRAVGLINHLSKCVSPARLFMSRLLAKIRAAYPAKYITIDAHVSADLRWFLKFLEQFNGKSLIRTYHAANVIQADACGSGFGAYDLNHAYSTVISDKMQQYTSTQLECINCLLALRSFISKRDHGTTVVVRCDNMPSIFAYAHGRAKDVVLAACARAAWYHAERCQVRIVYQHIPGVDMQLADALSRAHLKPAFEKIASNGVEQLKLTWITPNFAHLNFADHM